MYFSHSLLLVAPIILVLSACSSTTSKIKENLSFLGVNYKSYSEVSGTKFRGHLHYVDDQAYFKSCNSNLEYEITNNDDLYDIYETITDEQNEEEPVYIEFSGAINFSDHDESNSPVIIQVDQVQHMVITKNSLQCAKATDTFDFKAKGNTPYWRVSGHNKQLFFAAKVGNELYQLDNLALQSDTANHLKGVNDKGEQLFIDITPQHCYMLDNKEYWGFSTTVDSIYGEYNGCGELGHSNNTDLFKGEYFNQTQNISLTLNQDHTLEYLQINDGQTSLKTGFWKSNTQETVVVMLTTENDNKIQEELIFTLDQTKLFANQVNKNNAVTEFEQVLTFEKKDSQQDTFSDEKVIQIKPQFTPQQINPTQVIDLEVKKALQKYFRIHQTDPKNTQFSSVRFDLNGDGLDEAIVLLDWCSGHHCEMIIFEETKEGLNFSSRISSIQAPITISEEQHFSWQSLIAKNEESWLLFEFDGLNYPLHSRYGYYLQYIENSAEVTLFSNGKPNDWFLIK